jgi:hypothetical protein
MMCVHPSGFYAWCGTPQSPRALEDERLLGHIKHAWLESGSVYGYRKVTDDLRELGESCGKHRVYRLMKQEKLRSQTGYRRRPGARGGPVAVPAPNHLQRQLDASEPNRVWGTDITYIRTQEGWLFLAAVLDLICSVLASGDRLVDGAAHGPGAGIECLADGRLAPAAQTNGHGAFGPGKSIQQLRLASVSQGAQSAAKHEPARQLS